VDENTSSLLVYLLIFIFLYGVFAGGMLHVFSGVAEPTSGDTPPEPAGPTWWDPTGILGYLGTIVTYLVGLGTGFSTFGVPPPLSWILTALFWILVAAIVLLLARG